MQQALPVSVPWMGASPPARELGREGGHHFAGCLADAGGVARAVIGGTGWPGALPAVLQWHSTGA